MKRVVKKKSFYNVILLRDDSKVASFKLYKFWIKFFIYAFILMLLLTALATYGVYYYYNRYQLAAGERNNLKNEVLSYKVQAERLVHLEEWLRQTDPSRLNAVSEATTNGNAPGAELAQTNQQPEMKAPGLKVSEFRATRDSDRRMRVQFEVINEMENTPVTGKITFAVIVQDTLTPIVNVPQRDVEFQKISSRKRIRTTFGMPENIKTDTVEKVQVEVQCEGFLPYTEVIALDPPDS